MAIGEVAVLAGRLLIGAMFVVSALDKFRLPAEEIRLIESLHLPAPRTLERATGVFEIVAVAALVLGVWGRLAAALLALFVLFVSFAFLRFWSFQGPAEARLGMRNVFLANLAVAGGLIALAAQGLGRLVIVQDG